MSKTGARVTVTSGVSGSEDGGFIGVRVVRLAGWLDCGFNEGLATGKRIGGHLACGCEGGPAQGMAGRGVAFDDATKVKPEE